MFCVKLNELLKYLGVVGSGIFIGATFTGVAIQLPILIEAKWEGENKQLTFDSRTIQICEIEEIAERDIQGEELFSQ